MALLLTLAACTSSKGEDPEPAEAKAPAETETKTGSTREEARPQMNLPLREASAKDVEVTLRDLSVLVKAGASDPDNPWAMLHGLVAFGPELKAANGKPAVDAIASYVVPVPGPAGSGLLYTFPGRTPNNRPLSPHQNLVPKTFVGAGLPLDRKFEAKGREFTLEDLVRTGELTFSEPGDAHDWARQAWTLDMVFDVHGAGSQFQAQGWKPGIDALAAASVEALQRLQAFLQPAYEAGRIDQVEKQKQGIYAHTCGGLHFVQAVMHGAHVAQNAQALAAAREQLDLVLFRFEAERVIYRQVMNTHPDARLLLLVQQLKFFGHVLETFGLAAEWGVYTFDEATQLRLRQVAGDLIDTVTELQQAYGNQETLKKRAPQTYYDLIGDGCHAVRALRLARRHFYGDPS